MRKNDPRNDQREYATGNNENPLAVFADVPRPADHFAEHVVENEERLRSVPWFPRAEGPPETQIPKRLSFWSIDRAEPGISLNPNKWDVFNIAVPINTVMPVEIWPAKVARGDLLVTNVGTVSILVCPSEDRAMNGIGVTVAVGQTFTINTSAAGWAISTSATVASIAEVITSWFELPIKVVEREHKS